MRKKSYILPQTIIVCMQTPRFIAASPDIPMKGDYSDDNEEEHGGAGVLSRHRDHDPWNDEEETE